MTSPAQLVASERFLLKSKQVGDSFQIQVARPLPLPFANAPERFRVLYVLDGNLFFGTATEATRALALDLLGPIEPLLVVAVGYPVGEDLVRYNVVRCRDLTPPGTPVAPGLAALFGTEPEMGGADRFLRFLEYELDPHIRAEYPCVEGPAGLVGISYGGLFALYALFSRSPLFDRFIIGSPGILADDEPIHEVERRCHARGALPARVHLTLGELEETIPGFYNELARQYHALVDLLRERDYADLEWTHEVLDDETHMSAPPRTLMRGLRGVYDLQASLNVASPTEPPGSPS